MTTESTPREQIAAVTAECLATALKIPVAQISETDVLKELPGADSMKLLVVVSKLERHWDVEFDDQAIFAARTVNELIALVEQHVNGDLAVS